MSEHVGNRRGMYLPILKPDLYDSHIKPRVLCQLLPNMSRRLWTTAVSAFQRFQLFRRYRCSRPLACCITVNGAISCYDNLVLEKEKHSLIFYSSIKVVTKLDICIYFSIKMYSLFGYLHYSVNTPKPSLLKLICR